MKKTNPPKNKALWLILGVVLALGVAVGLYFGVRALIRSTNEKPAQPADTTAASGTADPDNGIQDEADAQIVAAAAKEVYTEDELAQDDARLEKTVASCGKYSIDNRKAQIFYGNSIYNFMDQFGYYASMIGLDTTQPLSGQPSTVSNTDESVVLSWEQYFLMQGMIDFHRVAAYALKAEAEGYSLPEEDAKELEEHIKTLREGTEADEANGPGSFYGLSVRMDDYEEYVRFFYLGSSYKMSVLDSQDPTDEDLIGYFKDHPEEFQGMSTDDPTNVNVRHILILSDPDEDGTVTDEEKAAAKAKAEELLQEYLKDPTEAHFSELAEQNTEDPGSKDNGGLYEDVYPGQMVDTFNDWCFDAQRETGDNGIVETEYGFHVMYFAGHTDNVQWKTAAKQGWLSEFSAKQDDAIMAEYPVEIRYEDVVLAPLPLLQQSEQPETTDE